MRTRTVVLLVLFASYCCGFGPSLPEIELTNEQPKRTYQFDWLPYNTFPLVYDGCQELGGWEFFSTTLPFFVQIPEDYVGDLQFTIAPVTPNGPSDSEELYAVELFPIGGTIEAQEVNDPANGASSNGATNLADIDLQAAYAEVKRNIENRKKRVSSMGRSQTYSVQPTSGNVYIALASRSVRPSQNLPYTATFTLVDYCNSGQEDPIFVGLSGQKFVFDGSVGSYYHIFSDEHISLNSLFVEANTHHKGTVLGAHGLRFGNSSITIDTTSQLLNGSLSLIVDGEHYEVVESYTGIIDRCIDIEWKQNTLTISNPTHRVDFVFDSHKTGHINKKHIDFNLRHPIENAANVGGLIGQTISRTAKINTDESKFITSDLLSLDAPTNVFQGLPMECQKQTTSRRSARSELRDSCVSTPVAPVNPFPGPFLP